MLSSALLSRCLLQPLGVCWKPQRWAPLQPRPRAPNPCSPGGRNEPSAGPAAGRTERTAPPAARAPRPRCGRRRLLAAATPAVTAQRFRRRSTCSAALSPARESVGGGLFPPAPCGCRNGQGRFRSGGGPPGRGRRQSAKFQSV